MSSLRPEEHAPLRAAPRAGRLPPVRVGGGRGREQHDAVAGADWVIDLGPGAGKAGGRVVAAGLPVTVATAKDSVTAPYLAHRTAVQRNADSELIHIGS